MKRKNVIQRVRVTIRSKFVRVKTRSTRTRQRQMTPTRKLIIFSSEVDHHRVHVYIIRRTAYSVYLCSRLPMSPCERILLIYFFDKSSVVLCKNRTNGLFRKKIKNSNHRVGTVIEFKHFYFLNDRKSPENSSKNNLFTFMEIKVN